MAAQQQEESKKFLGLLNGITRRIYYGEEEITNEFLKEQLYDNLSVDEFNLLVSGTQKLISSIVSADMDSNQLDAFLTSQTKKREGAITEDQAKCVVKFWKTHKMKIHESVISKSSWNNRLKNVSWRIDVKSQTRNIEQINTPTAIMELQIANGLENTAEADIYQFEMDEDKVNHVLKDMKQIQEQINEFCKNG